MKEIKTLIPICTPMFIAALFKVAKTPKQPKYLSTDKCINVRFHYMWEL